MASLYIVATPIGNLEDMTLRAVSVLSSVDAILAEDTRVTQKLCERFNIRKSLISYHQHSGLHKIDRIIEILKEGRNLALVSDAGTPGINDPGGYLVQEVLKVLPETKIVPIPGANAAVTALSASAFPADNFVYLGFVPQKKGRTKFFKEVYDYEGTVVFYESRYRILKSLEEMLKMEESEGARKVMVARELTKQFETLYRGSVIEIIRQFKMHPEIRGEFVVVVAPKKWQ